MGAAAPARAGSKVTLATLGSLHRRAEPITMITAHDFPSALVADQAGIDIILVGDSLAMVALGMPDTSEVSVDDMLLHCRSVSRAVDGAFTVRLFFFFFLLLPLLLHFPLRGLRLHPSPCRAVSRTNSFLLATPPQIGDLPMGSYEVSPEQALTTAIRFLKEGRVQAVKLEGGAAMAPAVRKITAAGIPVLGHVGLTPQKQHSLGGFRVQAKTGPGALQLLRDALAVQEAGCFAVVLEAVPAPVAALVTERLSIPTIGIGAGAHCSGQVLVQIDMTGNCPPGRSLPKFVKKFGDVWAESSRAIQAYRDQVKSGQYPAPEHTYAMPEAELKSFSDAIQNL